MRLYHREWTQWVHFAHSRQSNNGQTRRQMIRVWPVRLAENIVVGNHSCPRLLVQFAFFHEAHHGKQLLLKRRPVNMMWLWYVFLSLRVLPCTSHCMCVFLSVSRLCRSCLYLVVESAFFFHHPYYRKQTSVKTISVCSAHYRFLRQCTTQIDVLLTYLLTYWRERRTMFCRSEAKLREGPAIEDVTTGIRWESAVRLHRHKVLAPRYVT